MSSRMQAILGRTSYGTAVDVAYLAIQALWEGRQADSVLRVYPANDETAELLRVLLSSIEEGAGSGILAMPADARARSIAAIDGVVAELTRVEVS